MKLLDLIRRKMRSPQRLPEVSDAEVLASLESLPTHFSGASVLWELSNTPWIIRGTLATGNFNPPQWGVYRLSIAAIGETNTLIDPLVAGLLVVGTVTALSNSGTRIITYATGFESGGLTTITLTATRQTFVLFSVPDQTTSGSSTGFRWQLIYLDTGEAEQAIPNSQFTTAALASAAFAAGQLTGAEYTVFAQSGATPGTLTTRTATQMFADFTGAQVGYSYVLRVVNAQGVGTLTMAGGTGVTITGTATIAINTWRDFVVTFNSATTLTLQSVATGTYS